MKNKGLSKNELRKQFHDWLGDEFDNQNKDNKGETHRWLLCYDGLEGEENYGFDCACCLNVDGEAVEYDEKNNKWINKCGCHCHERITQIIEFFWERLNRDKLEEENIILKDKLIPFNNPASKSFADLYNENIELKAKLNNTER